MPIVLSAQIIYAYERYTTTLCTSLRTKLFNLDFLILFFDKLVIMILTVLFVLLLVLYKGNQLLEGNACGRYCFIGFE